ncbi:MAG: FAD-dependent thymidylate synthase [candidate division WOR-3 bacterium]
MKVILAGYNLDLEGLKNLKNLTPETISAAYARISRSYLSIPDLRREARKEITEARKSARTIIYDMGHHSIAEHSVFNFDIMNVSRLAVEEIEHFRLVSYTEKSQRYVKFEKGVFFPKELKSTPYEEEYRRLVAEQFQFYYLLIERLKSYLLKENPHLKEKSAENRAKEDARYCLPLSTLTQLGMTINARNLEYLLRNFAAARLREVKDLGKRLFSLVKEITPSLFLFYQATPYEERKKDIEKLALRYLQTRKGEEERNSPIKLLNYSREADMIIATAFLFSNSSLPFTDLVKIAHEKKEEIFKTACRHLEFYDALPREFELSHLVFEIALSASAFAQLKRHRMATLIKQPYSLDLGWVLPKTIAEIGEEKRFAQLMRKTNKLHQKIKRDYPEVADYILTNAHRRRVLLGLNARELYHIVRLRSDAAAQWEIREISDIICQIAKRKLPLTFFLLSGKDKYPEVYQRVFGTPPRFSPPVT